LRALSLCTCCRHYPGTATGGTALLIRPVMSAFPERVAGSACASSFSRLAQRSLALRPAHSRCHQFVARLPEGFRHFVTSMPAPVASGWSGCRAGLAPAGKRRLFTAHVESASSFRLRRRLQSVLSSRPVGIGQRQPLAGQRPSSRDAGAASGQPFEKPPMQVFVFRWTASVTMSDSAPHAVHDGRRPFWFVAVRWPRQAGMTLLTRRPLPSNRRPMPSCL